MSARIRCLLAGAVLLIATAALHRPPEAPGVSVRSALARSLGGLRIVMVDVLMLRADAMLRTGRPEEASELYRHVLELDPSSDAAVEYLVDSQFAALREMPDADERLRWWQSLRSTLKQAQALRPDAPRLVDREARLILEALWVDPPLAERLAATLGQPREVALDLLTQVARTTADLGNVVAARRHLDRFAYQAVHVAAQALVEGRGEALIHTLAVGREILALRAVPLSELMHTFDHDDDPATPERAVPLGALLGAGLDTITAVRQGNPEVALQAALRYQALVGGTHGAALILRAAAAR